MPGGGRVISVGCDVVDLAAVGPPLHGRFFERVLAPSERQVVNPKTPLQLWSHWAAKEAAFKVLSSSNPDIIFSPQKFIFDPVAQLVRVDGLAIPVRVEATTEVVTAVAVNQERVFQGERIRVFKKQLEIEPVNPSVKIRELGVGFLAEVLGIAATEPEIRSSGESRRRAPRIFIRNQESDAAISMSHDGRWVMMVVVVG